MRVLFTLCSVLIILQILDVPITRVSAAPDGKGSPQTEKLTKDSNTGKNQEKNNATNMGNETISDTKKNIPEELKKEVTKRRIGIFKALGGIFKFGSKSTGLLNRVASGTKAGLQRIGTAKYNLASKFGNSLVDGSIGVVNRLQDVGSKGKAVLATTSSNVAELAGSAINTTGTLVNVPITLGSGGLNLVGAAVKVPTKIIRSVSNTIGGFVGGDNNDSQENNKSDEVTE